MNVHCRVELGNEERAVLEELVYRGSPRVRKVKRALILLAADRGDSQQDIAQWGKVLGRKSQFHAPVHPRPAIRNCHPSR